jgi:hypothetical protein
MKFGAQPVILLKNGEQIPRQVIQVLVIDLANDGAVDRYVSGILGLGAIDKNIARVHIGVKETVAEYLREENFDAALCQQLDINLFALERFDVTDGHAVYSLADHDLLTRQWPVHLGNVDEITVLKVPPQLCSIGRLSLQIELPVNNAVIFIDNFYGLQAPAVA